MHIPHTLSKQGHELQFAVNYLGHFHLTQLLLPNLRSPGDGYVLEFVCDAAEGCGMHCIRA